MEKYSGLLYLWMCLIIIFCGTAEELSLLQNGVVSSVIVIYSSVIVIYSSVIVI